jgi:hypothetical protein
LFFPEENPKQLYQDEIIEILDQDEIIEILDQAKARDRQWHEATVNAKIDIFEMSHEEFVSYFQSLENLEMIRLTHGSRAASLP